MCACMRVYVHIHMYVYVYMCVCVYVYIYIYMYTVWLYICTCVGAFCLFVLSNPSTTCVCITGVFSTPACVCSGGLQVGFIFTLFMVSACYWRGRLCFDRGRHGGFVL